MGISTIWRQSGLGGIKKHTTPPVGPAPESLSVIENRKTELYSGVSTPLLGLTFETRHQMMASTRPSKRQDVSYNARRFGCETDGCDKVSTRWNVRWSIILKPRKQRFQRKSDLSRHERIHKDERPFICDEESCKKAFIQRSALTVHQRTHTGEKPHECRHAGCQKAFSDVCDLSFRAEAVSLIRYQSSSLARHRRIHSGKRPYECGAQKCGKR